ncbi:MAG: hypothetical protein QMC80_00595 [Thermoplasmatales archaeon]|nr:hypothetical protein [Thermoplasmatales archaeon]
MTRGGCATRQKSKVKPIKSVKGSDKVYMLDVFLIGGPVTKEFEGKEISRTVQIKGNQTLQDLHRIIFEAFDRWEEHLYEFILGKGPHDRSEIYSLPVDRSGFGDDENEGDVTKTTIESLGLKVDRAFGYRFDFGDDWLHQINVVDIADRSKSGKYQKIIKRVSESPPQYPDLDEDVDAEES